MNIEVNYLAVLLGAVASMVAGFMWYSPMLMGNAWMKESGLSMEVIKKQQNEMGKWYGLSFIVALISAFVLSHVMGLSKNFYQHSDVATGLYSALFMWLGFVMPVQLTDQIFGKKNWKLFAINTGYQCLALVMMGLTIALL